MSTLNPTHIDIIAEGMREVATEGQKGTPGTREDGQLWGAFPNTMTLTDLAAHVVSKLTDASYSIVDRGKYEIVPTGTSAALGAFANGSVTKQRVLEDIAYVLSGWRYEEPEDVWAAVAKVARDMGNAALVRAIEDSYAAAAAEGEKP